MKKRATAPQEIYIITATYEQPDHFDFDLITSKVEYFNGSRQYLHYLSSDIVSGVPMLRFMYLTEQDDDLDSFFEEIQSLENLLDTKIDYTFTAISEMNHTDLNHLKIAKRLMHRSEYNGDLKVMWSVTETPEVLDNVRKLIGFDEFKIGMENLRSYCDNVKRRGVKGNFNIVLVNKCEIDVSIFVNHIYDLLSAEKLINDHIVITGDLDDAARTQRDNTFLFNIEQRWDCNGDRKYLSASKSTRLLQKIAKKKTIYITSMDKTQYELAREVDEFRKIFTHVIELNEPTVDEKLLLLKQDAIRLGVEIDENNIQNSDILQMSQTTLDAALTIAAQRVIASGETKILAAVDFDKNFTSEEKLDPYIELQSMVGLAEVKARVDEIVGFLKKRGKEALPCLHMVFRGNPGSGKTTVARLIAKIFAQEGIIQKDKFVETDREGLVGLYVGHTAKKTADVVSEAKGGVLFIDEAYSLGYNDSGWDFGEEAIATLVKRMEDYRKDLVVIMAGYTDEMEQMLDVNPGLRDRVQFYIDFPDYSADELLTIFKNLCKAEKYTSSKEVENFISGYFSSIIRRKDKNFANARIVRKVFERVRVKQAMRVETSDDMVISIDDIDTAFAEPDMLALVNGRNNRMTLGFAA
ncbi:MAG: AAA family ATPase [Oscillospiraceae bacterium]|jgi:AAA+ superfamily predicted ATPase|nr:AAA family ATPase [Oscillospiraceae bacterium]